MSEKTRKFPRRLSDEQLRTVDLWARDSKHDIWGNDEARRFNLATFARAILESGTELGDGEPSPSPPDNNSETLARWIWANFVGIPVTEPYDKEYIALHDRIEKLQREWFVKGLTEARKQLGRSGAAQEVSPRPEPAK